jgi:chromosome segregation ATPase
VAAYNNENRGAYTAQLDRQLGNLKEELAALDNAETRLIRLFEFTPMSETKLKAEWDRDKAEQRKIEQQISDIEYRISSHRQKEYLEARIRELAGTLREVLEVSGSGFVEQRRQLFEDLNMKVWISKGFSTVELGLSTVPTPACDTVSTQS